MKNIFYLVLQITVITCWWVECPWWYNSSDFGIRFDCHLHLLFHFYFYVTCFYERNDLKNPPSLGQEIIKSSVAGCWNGELAQASVSHNAQDVSVFCVSFKNRKCVVAVTLWISCANSVCLVLSFEVVCIHTHVYVLISILHEFLKTWNRLTIR